MNPVIKRLVLKRFRSIPSETIEFDNPTIFVGRNASGKSNLIRAFVFLAEAMSTNLQAVFDKAGGITTVRNRTSGKSYPPNLGMRVEFGRINGTVSSGSYAFEVKALKNYGFAVVREQCSVKSSQGGHFWFDRAGATFTSNVSGLKPALDPASLGLPLVGGDENFAPILRTLAAMRMYSIEPGKLREMQDPDSGAVLRFDGGNVTSVLKEIKRQSPEDFQRISEILASIVPNTKSVEVIKHGKNLSLEITQAWGDATRLKFSPATRQALQQQLMSAGDLLRSNALIAASFVERRTQPDQTNDGSWNFDHGHLSSRSDPAVYRMA